MCSVLVHRFLMYGMEVADDSGQEFDIHVAILLFVDLDLDLDLGLNIGGKCEDTSGVERPGPEQV